MRDPNVLSDRLGQMVDSLPAPQKLIAGQKEVKVTVELKRSSMEFFKREAKKCNTTYERLIREVVERCAWTGFSAEQK